MILNRLACLTVLFAAIGQAIAADPVPGEYLAEGGWGTLNIKRSAEGKLHFDIESLGANGHSCSVSGIVKSGKAVPDDADPASPCDIALKPDAGGIDVALGESSAGCRYYCGMRASFDGRYLVPAPGCRNGERKTVQTRFSHLYGVKDYQAALITLQPVLTGCAPTLLWFEEAQIRNDLAVTLYHLGRKEECLAVLKPTIDAHGKTEDELREELPPSDFESFLPLAKAAWYNRKLCGGK